MAASKLTNEEKLKRILFTSWFHSKYTSGNAEKYSLEIAHKNPIVVDDLVKENIIELLEIVSTISEDKLLPRRSIVFYILARALYSENIPTDVKHNVIDTVLKLCKCDEEFFNFIKYVSILRKNGVTKLSKSVLKAIKRFYKSKSAKDLAISYAASRRYHAWSHKDLIKYGHISGDTPDKSLLINYILFGKVASTVNDDCKTVIDIARQGDILRKTQNEETALSILKEEYYNDIRQVNTVLHNSIQIWSIIIPRMPVQDILKTLPKLYKLGCLVKSATLQTVVTNVLTNVESVKASNIHPVEVFIHIRNYEKGGRPLDPKLELHLKDEKKLSEEEITRIKTRNEPKCPAIKSAIHRCLSLSYSNVYSTGKRFLITLDVSTETIDLPCLTNKNIRSIEGALAYTMSILKTEKDVTVAVFKDKEISLINLEKNGHFQDNLNKLKENKLEYLVPSSPIEWASNRKKHIDIFINFINHHEFAPKIPKDVKEKMQKPVEALQKYRKKVNLGSAKLLTFCMSSPHIAIADGSPNVLDVAGLDVHVPKIIEAFCSGNFS